MKIVDEQDEEGNWYQDFAIGNKFDLDLLIFQMSKNGYK